MLILHPRIHRIFRNSALSRGCCSSVSMSAGGSSNSAVIDSRYKTRWATRFVIQGRNAASSASQDSAAKRRFFWMQWRLRHANGSAATRRPYPACTSALSRGCCGGFRFGSHRQQLHEPIRIFPLSKRLRRIVFTSPTWRLRLAVRTQPSHGWCTGSIPVGVAILSESYAFRSV